MKIQWYPGHMYKASKELIKVLPKVDLLIEILDARIPFSSENPMLADIRGDKPCIKVLNKSDLADPQMTQQWQAYLEQDKGVKTLAINGLHSQKVALLPELCRKMITISDKRDREIHALIMGIPNVGKSTIINTLAGRTIAKTGNEPAVTKMQQRIDLHNGIVLLDTPGMLWPNIENSNSGYRLAATGAIKDTAMQYEDVASYTAEYLMAHYPELLKARFQLEQLPEQDYDFLEIIAKQRGCIKAGGHIDLNRISKILITEFRDNILGQITLETPEMMQVEIAEVLKNREAKAAKQATRKSSRKKRRR
jgi:ribosome biogenesis GTPase A